tara:strand:- start:396 stop:770 length:375 start_codon:yes stop_codon:yes gene_type:complete
MKTNKTTKLYKSIGEVAKILNLVDKKTGKILTHTIRFWEKEFKQINPHIFAGNRRYYDDKSIEMLKHIQFLLKDKGMTIKGVKKLLNEKDSKLDEVDNKTINTKNLKNKINKISSILKNIKQNG